MWAFYSTSSTFYSGPFTSHLLGLLGLLPSTLSRLPSTLGFLPSTCYAFLRATPHLLPSAFCTLYLLPSTLSRRRSILGLSPFYLLELCMFPFYPKPSTLCLLPYPFYLLASALSLLPSTLAPKPSTFYPRPQALYLLPSTLNVFTFYHKPSTVNPLHSTICL